MGRDQQYLGVHIQKSCFVSVWQQHNKIDSLGIHELITLTPGLSVEPGSSYTTHTLLVLGPPDWNALSWTKAWNKSEAREGLIWTRLDVCHIPREQNQSLTDQTSHLTVPLSESNAQLWDDIRWSIVWWGVKEWSSELDQSKQIDNLLEPRAQSHWNSLSKTL